VRLEKPAPPQIAEERSKAAALHRGEDQVGLGRVLGELVPPVDVLGRAR
jgi:hypothetical protein